MKFMLGCAIYDLPPKFIESVRAMFTIMSAQMHHPLVAEVVIVDNNPHEKNPLRNLPAKTRGFVRYIEMAEPTGTSAPRNRIFTEARNQHVVVADCHVLFYPGFFEALSAFYDQHGEDCPDVLHASMMTEAYNCLYATHMNDQWRSKMLGTWAWAWEKNGTRFSTLTRDGNGLEYISMPDESGTEQHLLSEYEVDALELPTNIPWACHEATLMEKHGCQVPTEPFPIPGHGMGVFACRKDSWLPFHPDARGFGGEEITTGYRFRRAGRLVWCVPGAKWWHHFDRHYDEDKTPYPNLTWDRVRNYVIEFRRLGLDLTPIREHFDTFAEADWQHILNGAVTPPPTSLQYEAYQAAQTEPAQPRVQRLAVPRLRQIELKI